MTQLRFTVRFHGPFAVATGVARDGLDTTIDPDNPLPSTAIKGLVKAQLRDVLGASPSHLASIFHGGDSPRWVWSDGDVDARVNAWTRVKVDDDGRSDERALMVGEQAHATSAQFVVTWEGPGQAPSGQILALRAGARLVTSLGSHRRRGMGWVSITDESPWDAAATRALREWLVAESAGA